MEIQNLRERVNALEAVADSVGDLQRKAGDWNANLNTPTAPSQICARVTTNGGKVQAERLGRQEASRQVHDYRQRVKNDTSGKVPPFAVWCTQ